jgi:hypothetical protein
MMGLMRVDGDVNDVNKGTHKGGVSFPINIGVSRPLRVRTTRGRDGRFEPNNPRSRSLTELIDFVL